MSDEFAILEIDDWWDTFGVIERNESLMFETTGQDLKQVQQEFESNPRKVWTAVDTDSGITIVPGLARVNRLYYCLTERALRDGVHVEIINPYDLDEDFDDFEPASDYVEST